MARRRQWLLVGAFAAAAALLIVGSQIAVAPPPDAGAVGPTFLVSPVGSTGSPLPPGSPTPARPSASPWLPSSSPVPVPTPIPPLAKGIVPILYLHRVQAVPADWASWTSARQRTFLSYDVLPAAFAADLDWLKTHGYTTILPRDLAASWDHGAPLPPRPVIITLDDGWASWTRVVLPMLKARGMIAEFYLTLDAISRGAMTWAEVRELAAAGMGIGAHDVHHVELANRGPGRPPASPAQMWYEVNQARIVIGREIGQPPDSMAYVGGGFNAELITLVKRAGYTTARSVVLSTRQAVGNRYALRVVAIGPCDDVMDVTTEELWPGLPEFAAKVTGHTTNAWPCPAASTSPLE